MKKIIVITVLALSAIAAHAATDQIQDVYSIEGKNFTSKAAAIRYIVASGKQVSVLHTRCEILTNKLTFKACPKNKLNNFENQQFKSLSEKE